MYKCEIAVKRIIPVARAMVAKKLIEGYRLSQVETSKRMGISQPAVSQYKANLRGRGTDAFADDARFVEIANDIAKNIAEGRLSAGNLEGEMCRFCKLIQS